MIVLPLPNPSRDDVSLSAALWRRRTIREFGTAPLSLQTIGDCLWAAQGSNDPGGLRTAPSAGALYPLELILVAGNVTDLPAGIYRYWPQSHQLRQRSATDVRAAVATAALEQAWIATAGAIVIVAAVPERTMVKYGERGIRYVQIEAGHAAQNLLLQAAARGIAAATVGAFDDRRLAEIGELGPGERPLLILPLGTHRLPGA